jgi:hypothetical protein
MNLLEKRHIYEDLQNRLARAIAATIKSELERRKLSTDLVKDITADLTFGIAALLDAETVIEIEDGTLKPVITFQTDEDTLIWDGGTSWMHDEVYGWVYDLFTK